MPIQCVAVRTPDQLKGNPAQSDSSSENAYTPDKDGFVQIVFVVNDNKVKAVQVESGIQSETHIEVLDGLSLGDEIVTGNYRAISQFLNNGTEVRVDNDGAESPGIAVNES